MTPPRRFTQFAILGPPVAIWPPAGYPTLIVVSSQKNVGGDGRNGTVGKILQITSVETIAYESEMQRETRLVCEWEATQRYCPECGYQGLFRALDTDIGQSGDRHICRACSYDGYIFKENPRIVKAAKKGTHDALKIAFGKDGDSNDG